jgi:biotin synthase
VTVVLNLEKMALDIMRGKRISKDEARELWSAGLSSLLFHADQVRRYFKGDRVHLCGIINAKSGACAEDCKFCAQSAHHATGVPRYPLVWQDDIAAAYGRAADAGACCFGVVSSGAVLSDDDIAQMCAVAPKLQGRPRLSVSFGSLSTEALRRLKASGVRRIHHNLETAESFFPNICTTHSFADRIETIRRAKAEGLEECSGGIMGLGETLSQRLELAFTLRELDVDSVPLNFLNPIPGTPFEKLAPLSGSEILRTIAVFRFILPDKIISVCGGREINLRDLQSWIFYAGASGMMVGGYLTTSGRDIYKDLQMIKDLGLGIEHP